MLRAVLHVLLTTRIQGQVKNMKLLMPIYNLQETSIRCRFTGKSVVDIDLLYFRDKIRYKSYNVYYSSPTSQKKIEENVDIIITRTRQ